MSQRQRVLLRARTRLRGVEQGRVPGVRVGQSERPEGFPGPRRAPTHAGLQSSAPGTAAHRGPPHLGRQDEMIPDQAHGVAAPTCAAFPPPRCRGGEARSRRRKQSAVQRAARATQPWAPGQNIPIGICEPGDGHDPPRAWTGRTQDAALVAGGVRGLGLLPVDMQYWTFRQGNQPCGDPSEARQSHERSMLLQPPPRCFQEAHQGPCGPLLLAHLSGLSRQPWTRHPGPTSPLHLAQAQPRSVTGFRRVKAWPRPVRL